MHVSVCGYLCVYLRGVYMFVFRVYVSVQVGGVYMCLVCICKCSMYTCIVCICVWCVDVLRAYICTCVMCVYICVVFIYVCYVYMCLYMYVVCVFVSHPLPFCPSLGQPYKP